jgi:hypothetical protein
MRALKEDSRDKRRTLADAVEVIRQEFGVDEILLTFPQGKTDDQVDSISQALSYEPDYYNLDSLGP